MYKNSILTATERTTEPSRCHSPPFDLTVHRVAQFLDASPVVERYAWFTDRWGADPTISLLMANASALTPTGQVLPMFVQRSKNLGTNKVTDTARS